MLQELFKLDTGQMVEVYTKGGLLFTGSLDVTTAQDAVSLSQSNGRLVMVLRAEIAAWAQVAS